MARKKAPYPLEEILSEFSDEQLRIIFQHIVAIELTRGCSIGCDFCGVEAERGVSALLRYSQIEMLVERFGSMLKESHPSLFWASDSLDWKEGNRDYRDINRLFEEKAGYHPFVSTAVPVGKEHLAHELLLSGSLERISVSHMNFNRLKKYFLQAYPDLGDQNKSFSVEKAKDGTRTVSFNNAPNNNGDLNWIRFIQALQRRSPYNGNYIFTPDGSRSYTDLNFAGRIFDSLETTGIGCYHGTLLRPTGLYNMEIVKPTEENRQGIVYTKIDPKNFFVWDRWFLPDKCPSCFPYEEVQTVAPRPDLIKPIPSHLTSNSEHTEIAKTLLTMCAYHLAHLEAGSRDTANLVDQGIIIWERLYANRARNHNPLEDPYYNRVMHALNEVEKAKKTCILN